jgi:hypothetical protein
MFFYIIALIPLIIGVYGLIFTCRNKNNMPFGLFGVNQKNYEVINKKEFNNVMIKQSLFISLCSIFVAVFIFIRKSPTACMYLLFIPLIQLLFTKVSRKYLKENNNG